MSTVCGLAVARFFLTGARIARYNYKQIFSERLCAGRCFLRFRAAFRGRGRSLPAGRYVMKIAVAGLGLIGGSAAKALRRAGYVADGWDREEIAARAVRDGCIGAAVQDFSDYDIVFVALPPDAAMRFIDGTSFGQGAIVADFCGVKGAIEELVCSRVRCFRYVGCHPMAGKEVSGYENSCEDLFDGASMIVTGNDKTDPDAVRCLEEIYGKMGFSCIVHCSAREHDGRIAYTSQLAHIVSSAYVKSPSANGFAGFTGGSFQDMTRIAGVDENLWSRLYMLNLPAVTQELSTLIAHLNEYLCAFRAGDEETLRGLLREGRERKALLDAEKRIL